MITDLPPRFKVCESSFELLRDDPKNDLIPHVMSQTDRLVDRFVSMDIFVRELGSTSFGAESRYLKRGRRRILMLSRPYIIAQVLTALRRTP